MSGPISIGGGRQPNAVVNTGHVENVIQPSGVGEAQPGAQGDVHVAGNAAPRPAELEEGRKNVMASASYLTAGNFFLRDFAETGIRPSWLENEKGK